MKKLSAAFGALPMTWPVVCAFAAIIGIYVGIINQIPTLYDTSFRDIAVTYEWWVLFAVLIVSNCKSAREAGMKCLAAHARMGQGAVLLLAHLAANFFAHTPGRSSRFLCQKAECVGCGNSRYRQYHCCPDGSKLFSEIVQCVPSALADGHFVCVDHCRSYFGNAEEVENKNSVGGNDCTADSRCYYLGCAQ